jgi:hypothetical protein
LAWAPHPPTRHASSPHPLSRRKKTQLRAPPPPLLALSLTPLTSPPLSYHQTTACGKHGYNDEGVGSWSGGCNAPKITPVDGTDARDQFNIISRVRLYYSEELGCVKGVKSRHGWANPPNLVTVGSDEFPEASALSLGAGEYITSVSWAAKDGCISYLSLKTNKGNEAAAGEAAGDVATFTAKDGQYLAAFKGATGNDESCSPLAALSFRWGYDDCDAPAPATCDAMFTCNGFGGVPCGVATCVNGQVVVGVAGVSKPTGLKCAETECAAAPAPAPLSVKTFSVTLGKKKHMGSRRLSGFGMEKIQQAAAGAQQKVSALKGMAQGAANQAVAAANAKMTAKAAAANAKVAAASKAVNDKVSQVTAAKAAMAAAKDKCFTVCKKEGLNVAALKQSLLNIKA